MKTESVFLVLNLSSDFAVDVSLILSVLVLTDAVFYDKWSNTDLSVHFHRNLGLKEYFKGKRGVLTDMLQWEENGMNHKCITAAEQKKTLVETLKSLGLEPPKE